MKIQILRVLVLLVSISAASVLVWNATRDQKSSENQNESVSDPDEAFDADDMQVSPKSGPVMSPDDVAEMVEEPIAPTVTEEEVKRKRDAMLSTSKSGVIMSDDKIRKLLEDQKKEELKYKKNPNLIPSSKNPIRLLEPDDVERIIERGPSDFIKPLEPDIPTQEEKK